MSLNTVFNFKGNLIPRFESLFWCGYLALLFAISFIPDRYESIDWQIYASFFYAFCVAYLCLLLTGGRFNKAALYYARVPIFIIVLILFWQAIQILLPLPNHLYFEIFSVTDQPDWFNPDLMFSSQPSQTRRIFFSNLSIFTWFLLSVSIITTRSKLKYILICMILIGLSHTLIGLYAKLGNIILVDKQTLDGHFDAARGVFINRNHYASFIGLTMLGALTFFFKGIMQEWGKRNPMLVIVELLLSPKLIYICAAVIGLIGLLLSQSRAGLFGFLSAFIFVVLSVSVFDKRITGTRVIFSILSLLLISLYWLFGQDMMARIVSDGFSVGERLVQWEITWQAIKDAPILGFGAGSYSIVFQVYREHADLRQVIFDQAHNEYLHVWLEQGLIGLSLFCALIISALLTSINVYRCSSSTLVSALMISCIIVVISALAQSFVDFNLQIVNVRCFFFVVLALIYAGKSLLEKPKLSRTSR